MRRERVGKGLGGGLCTYPVRTGAMASRVGFRQRISNGERLLGFTSAGDVAAREGILLHCSTKSTCLNTHVERGLWTIAATGFLDANCAGQKSTMLPTKSLPLPLSRPVCCPFLSCSIRRT